MKKRRHGINLPEPRRVLLAQPHRPTAAGCFCPSPAQRFDLKLIAISPLLLSVMFGVRLVAQMVAEYCVAAHLYTTENSSYRPCAREGMRRR